MAHKYRAEDFRERPQRTWPMVVTAISAALFTMCAIAALVVYIVLNL